MADDIEDYSGRVIINNSSGSVLIDFIMSLRNAVQQQRESYKRISILRFVVDKMLSSFVVYSFFMALSINLTLSVASASQSTNYRITTRRHKKVLSISFHILKNIISHGLRLAVAFLTIKVLWNLLELLNLYYHISCSDNKFNLIQRFIMSSWFSYSPEKYYDNKYMRSLPDQIMIGPNSSILWSVFFLHYFSTLVESVLSAVTDPRSVDFSYSSLFEVAAVFGDYSAYTVRNKNLKSDRPNEEIIVICIAILLYDVSMQLQGLFSRPKNKLIPSTIIGILFLLYYMSKAFDDKLSNFPTVVMISLFPYALSFSIIIISGCIFFLALVLREFDLESLSFGKYFIFKEDDEEDVVLSNTDIRLSDSFFAALMKLADVILSVTDEISYMKELRFVIAENDTWVEKSIIEKFKTNLNYLGSLTQNLRVNGNISSKNYPVSSYSNIISAVDDLDENYELTSESKAQIERQRLTQLTQKYRCVLKLTAKLLSIFKHLLFSCILFITKRIVGGAKNKKMANEKIRNNKADVTNMPKFLSSKLGPNSNTDKNIEYSSDFNLDNCSTQEVEDNYLNLMTNFRFSDMDNTDDYVYSSDGESSSVYDSDSDSINRDLSNTSFSSELFPETEILHYFNTMDIGILESHLKCNTHVDGILTRSKYKIKHSPRGFVGADEKESQLIDLILEKRKKRIEKAEANDVDSPYPVSSSDTKLDCVVCQVNVREIITWPCRCFAICESCRLTMVSRGFQDCVCCRRPVKGVSKVYIP